MFERFLHIGALAAGFVVMLPVVDGAAMGPPHPTAKKPSGLVITSPDKRAEVTAEQLDALPRTSVSIKGEGEWTVKYEGVLVSELLKLVGVTLGDDLRGPALASYALVEAADEYRVVFSLPELDTEATERVVLLADRRDGKPLDAKEGPLRIVIPAEKRHARWVRQVTTIHVREAPRTADREEGKSEELMR
jgi:hypothetical protein